MITFNSINIDLPVLDQEKISQWIELVSREYGKKIGLVNYIFVDDEEILRINRQFIGHDYYTDHIGFDYSQGNIISGDTYISLDTVLTNAELFNTEYLQELHRVIIHSILHLCGLEDYTDEERSVMEQAENKALAIYERKN